MTSVREGSGVAATDPARGTAAEDVAAHGAAARGARRRPLRAVLRDRRGATALVFAGSAVSVFGLVALATEGGNWYFTQRNARSAADMAAMAGAASYLRTTAGKSAAAEAAARDTAGRNGFVTGAGTNVDVKVESWTPPSPPFPAGTSALPGTVRVTIVQTVPTFLSGLLLGSDAVTIRVAARAAIVQGGPACVLALNETGVGLNLVGTANVSAPGCVLHANSTSSNGVRVQSEFASNLVAAGVSVQGGCFGNACDSLPEQAGSAVQRRAPPIPNPYEKLDTLADNYTLGKPQVRSDCLTIQGQAYNQAQATSLRNQIAALPASQPVVLCANNNNTNLGLNNGVTLELPGGRTYIFWNAGLSLENGTLRCLGCTIVFTGHQGSGGRVRVNGGQIELTPRTGTAIQSLPDAFSGEPIVGVSLYRDYRSPHNLPGGGLPVQINGNVNSYIDGAMVFPNSDARYNGTSSQNFKCNFIIGRSIEFSGTASLNTSECEGKGVRLPHTQVVRLVE
jgi:Flp pilus assembly protein TadG